MYWAYGPNYRSWCKAQACKLVSNRHEVREFLLSAEGLNGPIDYIEFGVSGGGSIRWWVEHNTHPDSIFVGFDTFEGLPEAWGGWPTGAFSTDGKVPDIHDPRCTFVKGLFQDTLCGWLNSREFTRRIVLHLDADLYSSTLIALTQLLPRLKSGDIIIFNEFRECLGEYRAYIDATTAYNRLFVPLCHTAHWAQVAFRAT